MYIFTVCNNSCRTVIFSQASVILSTGGWTPLWADTPQADTAPPPRQTPLLETPPPPASRRPLQRMVRILLEYILLLLLFLWVQLFVKNTFIDQRKSTRGIAHWFNFCNVGVLGSIHFIIRHYYQQENVAVGCVPPVFFQLRGSVQTPPADVDPPPVQTTSPVCRIDFKPQI